MSASAGVEISQAVTEEFQRIKLTKDRAWLIARLTPDENQIVLDDEIAAPQVDPKSCDGEENRRNFKLLSDKLTDAEPRFIVFDFRFETGDGAKVTKIGYIFWCSDNAPVKKKMIGASTNTSIKKAFSGLAADFQINDKGDLNYDELKNEIAKKK